MAKRIRLRGKGGKGRRLILLITAILGIVLCLCLYFYSNEVFRISKSLLGSVESREGGVSRGAIYDRNYKELAISQDRVSVYAKVREVDNSTMLVEKLAPELGVNETEMLAKLQGDSLRVWLAKNITQEQEEAVSALNLSGVFLHREGERYYPQKEKAAHLVGFVENDLGLAGVEYHFNRLKNEYGMIRKPETVGGSANHKKVAGQNDGQYLVVTVDLKIQSILENYLQEIARKYPGVQAGAVLMDCTNGAIIGMAHNPSYDPNHFRDYSKDVLENSLVHPVPIPKNLRRILRDTALLQAHYHKFGSVLPWSVVSGIGSLGSQVRLWDSLQLLDSLDLDFVTRIETNANTLRSNVEGDQQFETVPESATPIHLLQAIARLVNGGKNVVPHVVDRFINKWGEEMKPQTPGGAWEKGVGIDKPVSDEVVQLLMDQLEGGPISSGFLQDESYYTIQRDGGEQQFRNKLLLSLIPAQSPGLLLMISVTEPRLLPTEKEKASVQDIVSTAKKMVVQLVAVQEVMKNLSDMMSVEEKEEVNYTLERRSKNPLALPTADQEKKLLLMPDLHGLSLRKSLRLLQNFDLEIRIKGTGRVISQDPPAGTVFEKSTRCTLILAREVKEGQE